MRPGADIVRRPAHGAVSVEGYAVTSVSRRGQLGADSFTSAWRGVAGTQPIVRTVRVAVTVRP
jgi:hypothetical protein